MSKLITYRIIPPLAVVEWIFSEDIAKIFPEKYWIFELLLMTADQTVIAIELLQKKISEMESLGSNSRKEEADVQYKRAEDNLLAAVQEQREFFLRVFQRFETLLKSLAEKLDAIKSGKTKDLSDSNHVSSVEIKKETQDEKKEVSKSEKVFTDTELLERKLKVVLGIFHTIGRKYHKELRGLREMMELLLSNTHPTVAAVYTNFKALELNY